MSRLDDLPPDQRAALALLLSQGKDYAEVAALLQIGEQAVHDRAHAALAVLAPRQARELTPERRNEIGDYLLGQRSGAGERLRTRSLLEGSAAAQAWATALASELASLATAPLPEIPDGTRESDDGPRDADRSPPRAGPVAVDAGAARNAEPSSRAPATSSRPTARTAAQLPSSRVGGAILLAVIAGVVVAVVLLTSGGASHHTTSTRSGSSTGTSATPRASETRRLALTAPSGSGSKAIGVAAVLQEGNTYAFYLAAERLVPSNGFFYAVWLYNSPTSYEPLSRSPPVKSDGRLQWRAPARRRLQVPPDDRDQGDERTSHPARGDRPSGRLRPALIRSGASLGS
jgi:Sigma-70, region 4